MASTATPAHDPTLADILVGHAVVRLEQQQQEDETTWIVLPLDSGDQVQIHTEAGVILVKGVPS